MPINQPGYIIYAAGIATPGGGTTIHLEGPDQLRLFNENPDAYAAKHFDLTELEYVEWINTDGTPLCSAEVKAGGLCKRAIGPVQQPAYLWVDRHRKARCSSHGGE